MKARRLRISADLWVEFLKCETPTTLRVSRNALPADANCVGMEGVATRNEVHLWIESAAFRDDDPIDLVSPVLTRVDAE